MKRFETFGEYMSDLLPAPLKRARQAANQFFIFFKVVGREFDDMKNILFRVRDEANVVTASPPMLAIHGQDRNMPRLPGEDDETYRMRLAMKGLISEWGGTKKGILYALAALGYLDCTVQPLVFTDPDRWAEFLVSIRTGLDDTGPDTGLVRKVVRDVKQASSKDSYLFEFTADQHIKAAVSSGTAFLLRFYPLARHPYRFLDSTWTLDGSSVLSGYSNGEVLDSWPLAMEVRVPVAGSIKGEFREQFPARVRQETVSGAGTGILVRADISQAAREYFQIRLSAEIAVAAGEIHAENMNGLDSSWVLDGTRTLNGGSSVM